MQSLPSTLVSVAISAVSVIVLLLSLYALYRIGKFVAEQAQKRKHEAGFKSATLLAAKYPPPDGYGINCCVAMPINPSDPISLVKYVVVLSYTVLDLGEQRLWMLNCDDGQSYLHTSVMPVPGGIPSPSTESGENTVSMGST